MRADESARDRQGPVTTVGGSRYRELGPPTLLADRVVCLWTQSVAHGQGDHTVSVLPDGCVDLIWSDGAAPFVAGPATRHVVVTLAPGTLITGVRLRPGWAQSCLGISATELLDRDVPLEEMWGRAARGLTASGNGDGALPTAVAARLASAPEPDPVLRVAVPWLVRHPVGRIRDLARITGCSDRHLFRRFQAAVGYGPKTFQRIARFQRLLAAASAAPSLCGNQARLAAALSYSDQAHMCREVRALSGKSPSLLLERGRSTLFMAEPFKPDGKVTT